MASFDYRSILRPKSALPVFNPNTEAIKKDFNGNTYTFPAGGVLNIEDSTGKKFTSEGVFEDFPLKAEEIVAHFVGEDGVSGHLGPLGVRVLSGNPEVDEQIKAEALATCKQRKYINDLAIKNAHMAAVRVAKEGGNPAPTPERHVVEAMTRIAEYEAGGNQALPFSCQDCAMPFLTQDEVGRHAEAQHKGAPVSAASNSTLEATIAAQAAQIAALTDLVKTVVAARETTRKPGRPRKAVEA